MRYRILDWLSCTTIVAVVVAMTFFVQSNRIEINSRLFDDHSATAFSKERVTFDWLVMPLLCLFNLCCALAAWIVLRPLWYPIVEEEDELPVYSFPPPEGARPRRSIATLIALAFAMPVLTIPYFPAVPGGYQPAWPVVGVVLAGIFVAIWDKRFVAAGTLFTFTLAWNVITIEVIDLFKLWDGC